jgi:hypothetical protein
MLEIQDLDFRSKGPQEYFAPTGKYGIRQSTLI